MEGITLSISDGKVIADYSKQQFFLADADRFESGMEIYKFDSPKKSEMKSGLVSLVVYGKESQDGYEVMGLRKSTEGPVNFPRISLPPEILSQLRIEAEKPQVLDRLL